MDWLIDLLPSGAAVGNALWLLVTFLLLLLVVPLAALGLPGSWLVLLWCAGTYVAGGKRRLLVVVGCRHCGRGGRRSGRACAWYCRHQEGWRWEAWHVGGCHRLAGRRRGGTVRPPTGDRGHSGGHARGVHWGLCWRDVLRGTQQKGSVSTCSLGCGRTTGGHVRQNHVQRHRGPVGGHGSCDGLDLARVEPAIGGACYAVCFLP